MNILLYILLGVVGFIAFLLILALFTKKGYSIKRQIIIDRPVTEVYDFVRHLKNQDIFSKWVQSDPGMQKIYKGTDGEVGFVYGWNGNKQAGEGEQEIMKLIPGKFVDVEVRFVRPFKAVAKTPFSLEDHGGVNTTVTWSMTSAMTYPMNLFLLIMDMDKALGKDMETSLGVLKQHLEK